ASASAALLVVDAWFDVTTSSGGKELITAALTAFLVELPLAVFSLIIAARAQIEIARSGVEARSLLLRLAGATSAFGIADRPGATKAGANPPVDSSAPAVPLAAPLVAGAPLTA